MKNITNQVSVGNNNNYSQVLSSSGQSKNKIRTDPSQHHDKSGQLGELLCCNFNLTQSSCIEASPTAGS